MKKLILFFLPVIFFTSCTKLEYSTFTKIEVGNMMKKYQELEGLPNPPYLPPTIQMFDMKSKTVKILAQKGIRVRIITGAIYLSGSQKDKQAVIIQLKFKDGTFEYIDFATLKIKNKDAILIAAKAICPEPPDCSTTIED